VEIESIVPSIYLLRVSAVGFAPTYSGAFEVKEARQLSVPSIRMIRQQRPLQGVTVSARKPYYSATKTIA
jgi:hypothetical protein